MAKVSKRGEEAVAMRRILLDAYEAGTDADYAKIMQRLRTYVASRGLGSAVGLAVASPAANDEHDRHAAGPLALTSDECTSEWDGVVYVDECATAEEIDNALLEIEAMEAEVAADYDEAVSLCMQIYGEHEPWVCDWRDYLASSFATTGWSARQGFSIFSLEGGDDTSDCNTVIATDVESGLAFDRVDCINEGIEAGAYMSGLILGYFTGRAVLNKPFGVARAAKGAVITALTGAAFTTGWMIGSYINCVMNWD